MIHYCEHCDFKSNHRWVVRRHADAKHSDAQHKFYSNNKKTVIENKTIQEANQIEHHHEPLPSVQHGTGVVREQDNQRDEISSLLR